MLGWWRVVWKYKVFNNCGCLIYCGYLVYRDFNNLEKNRNQDLNQISKKNMKYRYGKYFIVKINKFIFVYKDKI